MQLHVGLPMHLPHLFLSPLHDPCNCMSASPLCFLHGCTSSFYAIARSAIFCFSLMHTPPLSCNVTPTFPDLVLLFFVHATYNTPLSSRSLHRLLWVTYLFVLERASFSPTFLPCWCFFSKTTTGAVKFCCFFWFVTLNKDTAFFR